MDATAVLIRVNLIQLFVQKAVMRFKLIIGLPARAMHTRAQKYPFSDWPTGNPI